jgi:enamine deaminase RidA (YjgF/YER057c/UK114 family)
MRGCVEHLNSKGLHKNPAYSQAVVANGNVKSVYMGRQNAVDTSGNVVGADDVKVQA